TSRWRLRRNEELAFLVKCCKSRPTQNAVGSKPSSPHRSETGTLSKRCRPRMGVSFLFAGKRLALVFRPSPRLFGRSTFLNFRMRQTETAFFSSEALVFRRR